MRKFSRCGVVILSLMAPVGVHAQTVEECMAEVKKVQAFIDSQEDQDRYEHASSLLVHAEFSAGKGEGKKCMEFAKQAKGSAESLGQD